MNIKDQFPGFYFIYYECQAAFELISKKDCRFYLAGALAGRTFFICGDAHFRPYSLPCNLQKAEFCQRKNVMLSPVISHQFPDFIEKLLSVFSRLHIDKIDHYNTAHIP